MSAETINREAGDKSKGPRLQKLRAILLILDAVEKNKNACIFSAVEYDEDVYLMTATTTESRELYEEDKNYDDRSVFTFNREQILNTMVSFLDIWIKREYSPNVNFGYYSTTIVGKEKITSKINSLGITLPDKPILELISKKQYDYPHLRDSVVSLIKREYKDQYSKDHKNGNLDLINKFSNQEWDNFFSSIDWFFGQDNEDKLKKKVLTKISTSRLFNQYLKDKEEIVLASLMELFDERQTIKDGIARFVYEADVVLAFKEAEREPANFLQEEDPVWKLWEDISPPTDLRNINDKIIQVCETYNTSKLEQLARKVCRSKIEETSLKNEKCYLAMKYRVYEKCNDLLLANNNNFDKFTESEIDELINQLTESASEIIERFSSQFYYTYNNKEIISGMLLSLFDDCYLAFDEM